MGIKTAADLRHISQEKLIEKFGGQIGSFLYLACWGQVSPASFSQHAFLPETLSCNSLEYVVVMVPVLVARILKTRHVIANCDRANQDSFQNLNLPPKSRTVSLQSLKASFQNCHVSIHSLMPLTFFSDTSIIVIPIFLYIATRHTAEQGCRDSYAHGPTYRFRLHC